MAKRNPAVFALKTLLWTGICVAIFSGSVWFHRARNTSASNACINNLRQLDSAIQQWAIESGKRDADPMDVAAVLKNIKGGKVPNCPGGGQYVFGDVIEGGVHCSILDHQRFSTQQVVVLDESGKSIVDADVLIGAKHYKTDTNGWATTLIKYEFSYDAVSAVVFKPSYQTNRLLLPSSGRALITLTGATNSSTAIKTD